MTFAAALPTLLQLRSRASALRAILRCKGQPALHAVPDAAREIANLDWSVCPLDLLDGPHLRAVQQLDRLGRAGFGLGAPERYSAWAVGGLLALRGEA